MKKLIVGIAIALAATMTQAAQFSWKTANYNHLTDASGAEITTAAGFNSLLNGGSIVAVLVAGETYTDLGASSFRASGAASTKYGIYGSYAFDASASSLKDGDVINIMFKDSAGTYSWLVDGDGNDIVASYTVSGLDAADPKDAWSASFAFGTAGTSSSPNTFTTSVPEPTSGLLLLLGMAGLALKRKRA